MRLIGVDVGCTISDATTLRRFRNKLIDRGLNAKLFDAINKELERIGGKVDRADEEARWLKKESKSYYGI